MSYTTGRDDASSEQQPVFENLAQLFRESVAFTEVDRQPPGDRAQTVTVETLESGQHEPRHLDGDRLPLIALPAQGSNASQSGRVIVALEGADRHMAEALGSLLDPERVSLALIHVTWLSGIVTSPLDERGLDDPEPSDLLLYRGAREALVLTADELRAMGFDVRTHLREHRDPAVPIAELSKEVEPALITLGLGRHGAGIGQRLLSAIDVPVLFVRAR